MANLFDYISWRGDLEFDRLPFNPVDNIVFSQLSYLPMDGIVPGLHERGSSAVISSAVISGAVSVTIGELAAKYAVMQRDNPSGLSNDITVNDAISVINAIGSAPRYKDCKLFGYTNNIDIDQEKQFAAFCAIIGKKHFSKKMLVVYRGTDMTLVGWKESFNMSFITSIPSQKEAVSYLEKAAGRFRYPLIIAGHSKGGNLAIYASAFCSKLTRKRIAAIYSNDAPGFHKEVIQSGGYRAICSRIQSFIPQSSLVGMLFEHGEIPMVIKSSASGPMQHNLCSWEVTYNNMVNAGELTPQSRFIDNIICEWINQIDEGQRQQFIQAIYSILVSCNAASVADLTDDWKNTAGGIINALINMDKPTKKLMGKIIGNLFNTARKNFGKRGGIKTEPSHDPH
ncbi:MAG: DUF2974 domain-containing protein [Treponema sp.]|jgi:hypothetical protein|nr:DUF2974 domain-containing protein [Treponema sp.]